MLVWQQRSLRYLALISLCFSAIQLSVSAFTVALLVEDLQVNLMKAGLVMSPVQLFGVGGRLFWGWVADRAGNRLATLGIIAVITAVGALAVTTMSPSWPLWLTASLLCLLGTAALGWNGVFLAEAVHLAPPGRIADTSGGCLVFTYGGVLLGLPAFTALHASLGSYTALFAVLATIALLGLYLAYQASASIRREKQPL